MDSQLEKIDKNGQMNPNYVVGFEEVAYPQKQSPNAGPRTPHMDYEPDEQKRMFKNVIIISFSFTFLFTAYNSMANLQSSLNPEDGLGTYSLSVLYACLVLSSMFVPTYLIRRMTVKWTLFMSMFGYAAFIGLQAYPTFYTLIPGAILVGLCGAPLWSAKCTYLTLVGNQYAEVMKDNAEVVVVRFFGIFFLFFQSSSIWGNLISSVVLSMGSRNSTGDIDKCGVEFCPGDDDSEGGKADKEQVYMLCGIYLACALVAAGIIGFFVDSLMRYGEDKRVGGASDLVGIKLVFATFKHMAHPYQILIIPLTIWSGMEQGFFSAEYTQAYITCSWGIDKVGYVLICYGVCDAIASISFGPIIRKTGRLPIFTLGALINVAVIIVLFTWRPDPNKSQVMFFAMAGLWGIADAIWQTQINAFYGVIFPNNTEPAFSNYRLWESIGFIIAYAESSEVCVRIKLWILVVVIACGMVGYYMIEWKEKKNPQIPSHSNNKSNDKSID